MSPSASRTRIATCPRRTTSSGSDSATRERRAFGARSTTSWLQLYPGLFWPPTLVTQTAGEATVEAITLLRRCWMPRAKLADSAHLDHRERLRDQPRPHGGAPAAELADTLQRVHEYSGELDVTDYRYFNLRDTGPTGPTSSTTSASFVRTTRASRRSGPTASSWASWGNSRPRLAAADNGMSHFGPICERSEE